MPVTGDDEEFTEINSVVVGSDVVVVLEMLDSAFEATLEASPVIKSFIGEYFQNDKRDRQKRMDRLLSLEITRLSSWDLWASTASQASAA